MSGLNYHLAYVFERFPSFTQTFCAREVLELERQGVRVLLFSIRDTREEPIRNFPAELRDRVHYLPVGKELVEEVKGLKKKGKLPQSVVLTLRHWGEREDKMRVYEAAWIGWKMEELGCGGLVHVHTHFGGVGARCAWWLRRFYAKEYSFTGHANDVFCQEPEGVTLNLKSLMRDATHVVTVSDFSVGLLEEKFPVATGKVVRVYNGMDLGPFERASEGGARGVVEKSGVIVTVGRLIEKKGFGDLIRACGRLRDRGVGFRCLVVGEGPLEDELGGMIGELGLGGKVELCGGKSTEEIIRMLAEEAQVFALPCVMERDGGMDNLPTVIMEAMAVGLPVVSTRLAGVPEMVIDGETGVVVEPGDVEGVAGGLERLLGDADLCREWGERGRARARECFDKEVTAGQLKRLFVERGFMVCPEGAEGMGGAKVGQMLRRFWRVVCGRSKAVKVRDKGFDLGRFMDRA